MSPSSADSNISKRRRFQPPITSFFASAGSYTNDDDHQICRLTFDNYSSPTHTPTPTLPTKVQSSLLTVGMRIRKSVPEGYKTEKPKLTAFSGYGIKSSSDSFNSATSSQIEPAVAELLPFCGIHKIGNHAVQTFPRPLSEYQDDVRLNGDEALIHETDIASLPSSSQESNVSSVFSVNPNKRSYDSDDEEEWIDEVDDLPARPVYTGATGDIWQDPLRSNPVVRHSYDTQSTSARPIRRPILSPKTSQQKQQYFPSFHRQSFPYKQVAEQENNGTFSIKTAMEIDGSDFEEASFLRHPEELDYERHSLSSEVEMGG